MGRRAVNTTTKLLNIYFYLNLKLSFDIGILYGTIVGKSKKIGNYL